MRKLINRLRKEKVSIEQSLIDKKKTGITADELRDCEWKLNRIETILSGVKDNGTKYKGLFVN